MYRFDIDDQKKTRFLFHLFLAPQIPSNPLDDRQQGPPSIASTLRDLPKARTPSVPDLSRQTRTSMNIIPPAISTNSISRSTGQPAILSVQDDIRLCTINRADASDPFGIELNYHKREQFHSLSITPGRDGGRSSTSSDLIDRSTKEYNSLISFIFRCGSGWYSY